MPGSCDPHLAAVDDVVVTVSDGLRPNRLHVAPRSGFGHAVGRDAAVGYLGQVALLLILGAACDDWVGSQHGAA